MRENCENPDLIARQNFIATRKTRNSARTKVLWVLLPVKTRSRWNWTRLSHMHKAPQNEYIFIFSSHFYRFFFLVKKGKNFFIFSLQFFSSSVEFSLRFVFKNLCKIIAQYLLRPEFCNTGSVPRSGSFCVWHRTRRGWYT